MSERKKPRNKTINLKDIQKIDKQMSKMSTYVLERDYEKNVNTIIKYYEVFSQEKIDDLLKEAYEAVELAEKEGLPFFEGENQDSDFMGLINFLVAVRFTSLDSSVPKDFSKSSALMISMYNQGLTHRIINDVLDPAEVHKIFEKLEQYAALVSRISDMGEDIRKEALEEIENEEILKRLKAGKN